MVIGQRFFAFLPLGNRNFLESEIMFLLEAYRQPYQDIMNMPSSRRHRIVKMKEDMLNMQKAKTKGNNNLMSMPGLMKTGVGSQGNLNG